MPCLQAKPPVPSPPSAGVRVRGRIETLTPSSGLRPPSPPQTGEKGLHLRRSPRGNIVT